MKEADTSDENLLVEARQLMMRLDNMLPRSDPLARAGAEAGAGAGAGADAGATVIIPSTLPNYNTVGELIALVETGTDTCSPMVLWINATAPLIEQPWSKAWGATADTSSTAAALKKKLSTYLQIFCFVKLAVYFGKYTADTAIRNKAEIGNLSAGVFKNGTYKVAGLAALGGPVPDCIEGSLDYHPLALKIISFIQSRQEQAPDTVLGLER
jgi:hypothetical protein